MFRGDNLVVDVGFWESRGKCKSRGCVLEGIRVQIFILRVLRAFNLRAVQP